MNISSRIKLITDMTDKGEVCADIGCDHALTLIKIITDNKAKRGIGCDIGKGPLAKAQENITAYKLNHIIELRHGDGLSPILPSEADMIIISGMGGLLIKEILLRGFLVLENVNQLILQPQTEIAALRQTLHTLGFYINDENIVYDNYKYYTVIKALKGNETYNKDQYLLGRILPHKGDPVFKQYVKFMLNQNLTIINRLKSGSTENTENRLNELYEVNQILERAL